MMERIERAVFFGITRLFAWVVIVFAVGLLVYSAVALFRTWDEPGISVSYDEIQAVMDGKDQVAGLTTPAGLEENISVRYGSDMRDFFEAFGEPKNEQNERVLLGWIKDEDKKDRKTFIRGLVEALRNAPQGKRADAANTYRNIWREKKTQQAIDSVARSAKKTVAEMSLAGAFGAIALFSQILVALAIEKNTRT